MFYAFAHGAGLLHPNVCVRQGADVWVGFGVGECRCAFPLSPVDCARPLDGSGVEDVVPMVVVG